ncbi:MAG: exosortase/archaeosortase family protein [Pirellulales bacterium]|nr:exosortase/archaeosortase family protein [Pirellulales bacterium]
MQTTTATVPQDQKKMPPAMIIGGIALVAIFLVGYFETFVGYLFPRWWYEIDYNYCFFVLPFAIFLAWDRREMMEDITSEGSYWGLIPILVGAGVWWYASYECRPWVVAVSMLPLIAGMVLFIGGWRAAHWLWPSVLFLGFMFPLPGGFAGKLRLQLQEVGTQVSVFTLQTIGIRAVAEGNTIVTPSAKLGVVEACSGIRMLMLFFAACIGAAMFIRRDMLTRILIVLSAVPIAIIANVTRITVTALLYDMTSPELAERVFHDLAGWFMMPFAIVILWGELALFDRLFAAPERESPLAFNPLIGGEPVNSAPARRGEKRETPLANPLAGDRSASSAPARRRDGEP